jgi:3-polyprenyl-4-hydroxybenzoate decarboxylase
VVAVAWSFLFTLGGAMEIITDFFAGKVLDLLGLEHNLYRRWSEA